MSSDKGKGANAFPFVLLVGGVVLLALVAWGWSRLDSSTDTSDVANLPTLPPRITPQNILPIEEVESINSFRMSIVIDAIGEAFEEGSSGYPGGAISITGEFIKAPLAQHFVLELGDDYEAAMLGNIEVIRLGDMVFTKFAGTWIEGTVDDAPDLNDFFFIKREDMRKVEALEWVGEENINGRDTAHYRGDKEALAALSDEDTDMSHVEEVQLDVWIDQEAGFIVKMELIAFGAGLNDDFPEATGELTMHLEYSDFNKAFTIEAPDVETPDINELLGLTGFELPEGASVELSMPGFVQATVPMELAEAQAALEESLTSSGFEIDTDLSFPDAYTYVFTNDAITLTVILVEGNGQTSIIVTNE